MSPPTSTGFEDRATAVRSTLDRLAVDWEPLLKTIWSTTQTAAPATTCSELLVTRGGQTADAAVEILRMIHVCNSLDLDTVLLAVGAFCPRLYYLLNATVHLQHDGFARLRSSVMQSIELSTRTLADSGESFSRANFVSNWGVNGRSTDDSDTCIVFGSATIITATQTQTATAQRPPQPSTLAGTSRTTSTNTTIMPVPTPLPTVSSQGRSGGNAATTTTATPHWQTATCTLNQGIRSFDPQTDPDWMAPPAPIIMISSSQRSCGAPLTTAVEQLPPYSVHQNPSSSPSVSSLFQGARALLSRVMTTNPPVAPSHTARDHDGSNTGSNVQVCGGDYSPSTIPAYDDSHGATALSSIEAREAIEKFLYHYVTEFGVLPSWIPVTESDDLVGPDHYATSSDIMQIYTNRPSLLVEVFVNRWGKISRFLLQKHHTGSDLKDAIANYIGINPKEQILITSTGRQLDDARPLSTDPATESLESSEVSVANTKLSLVLIHRLRQ